MVKITKRDRVRRTADRPVVVALGDATGLTQGPGGAGGDDKRYIYQ